jgi:hypothetical protein
MTFISPANNVDTDCHGKTPDDNLKPGTSKVIRLLTGILGNYLFKIMTKQTSDGNLFVVAVTLKTL